MLEILGSGSVLRSGTGVAPLNHAQDACATIKLIDYQILQQHWKAVNVAI